MVSEEPESSSRWVVPVVAILPIADSTLLLTSPKWVQSCVSVIGVEASLIT